jgi:hypothetical protein
VPRLLPSTQLKGSSSHRSRTSLPAGPASFYDRQHERPAKHDNVVAAGCRNIAPKFGVGQRTEHREHTRDYPDRQDCGSRGAGSATITLGSTKIPEPITIAMTIAVASSIPSGGKGSAYLSMKDSAPGLAHLRFTRTMRFPIGAVRTAPNRRWRGYWFCDRRVRGLIPRLLVSRDRFLGARHPCALPRSWCALRAEAGAGCRERVLLSLNTGSVEHQSTAGVVNGDIERVFVADVRSDDFRLQIEDTLWKNRSISLRVNKSESSHARIGSSSLRHRY